MDLSFARDLDHLLHTAAVQSVSFHAALPYGCPDEQRISALFLFVVAFLWATKRLGADTAIIGYTLTLLVTGLSISTLPPFDADRERSGSAELHKTG